MLDIIMNNLDSVAVIILFIVLIAYLTKRGATKKVNEMLFYLVTEAETVFGSGTGELKYSAVTTWIYDRLPTILKLLFTSKQLDTMIEDAVVRMKEYLKENPEAKVRISID